MVDSVRIRVTMFKNMQNPTSGVDVLVDPRMPKDQMLKLAAETLEIKAKKIFNASGTLLNSFESLSDGAQLFVSQGENFQVKTRKSTETKTSKKYVLAMLGAASVGKSAITFRYVSNKFVKHYDPTIEDYYTKNTVLDGEPTVISILDTAGMEDYYPLIDDWIDNKDGFILVFSVETPDSLQRLKYFYEKIAHRYSHLGNKGPAIVIAANKVDIERRNVSPEEGKKFADELGVKYYEVSAAQALNIDELFSNLIRELKSKREQHKPAAKESFFKRICTLL